ncbi:MAG: hypothetical protein ACYTGY_11565 [Planctomycetota bacterium]
MCTLKPEFFRPSTCWTSDGSILAPDRSRSRAFICQSFSKVRSLKLAKPKEDAVGTEHALSHERMDVRVPIKDLTRRMDGGEYAGRHIASVQDGAVDSEHGLPGQARPITRQPAVMAEQDPPALGDGEDDLSVDFVR